MQQISIHIIQPSDLLQPSLYNLPPKSLCFCDSICSLLYRKILSYFKCLKEGKKDGQRARDVCVCVISIPRRGFILQNVSSTWSRLRAQGHSMMGLIRVSLEVEQPCQRGVCLTRLCSPRYGHLGSKPERRRSEWPRSKRAWASPRLSVQKNPFICQRLLTLMK